MIYGVRLFTYAFVKGKYYATCIRTWFQNLRFANINMVYKLDVSDCANIVCNDEIGMVTIFSP